MALLWIEGFEGFGTTIGSAPAPAGALARKYPVNPYGDLYVALRNGRTGGYGLEMTAIWPTLGTVNLTTNATLVVGFAFYFSVAYAGRIISLYDDSTDGVNLRLTTGGELEVRRGDTILGTTSGLGLTVDSWYWIELKVVCNDSGSYELRVGGVNELSASGVDTKAGSHDYHSNVILKGPQSGVARFDDLYVCDGSGAVNNDFLGNRKVVAILPDGDVVGYQDFTCSSGSDHYALVDENPINDDTDYVESSTPGHQDLWDYAALSGVGTTISGLQINTMVRETDATSFSLITLIKSGTTEDPDAGQAIGTTNYVNRYRISETDPDTAAAWTESGVNAAAFGVEVD